MKGFVTLAVGDLKYYKLAANLLKSYRMHTTAPFPWAIYSDRENEYTQLFDKVILVKEPHMSYLDKIEMLNNPAFEENIFIDADCLAYGDLNQYWEYTKLGGVRCIGRALQLDSTEGWFDTNGVGKYAKDCAFIPQMHGGIIFFSKDDLTNEIYIKAKQIASEYDQLRFRYFSKPADEPILALSMAITNCPPVELCREERDKAYCFFPAVKKVRVNIKKGICKYSFDGKKWIAHCLLIHWQNLNTERALYRIEMDRINGVNGIVRLYRETRYYLNDAWIRFWIAVKTCVKRILCQ